MDKKVVSFSPNLYPYIDHGWATTIHKAQGTTVDHVKLLASYEQYRNLTYVGMSRHRHSLQVFASDLDFWRDAKIFDRLSRVQEKLSGFDYMDTKKLEEQINEDTPILWHERKIQQGKDLLVALKVTAQDVLGLTTPHAKAPKHEYQSFETSEEMRSKEVFKAHGSNAKETAIIAVKELDYKRMDFDKERLPFHQNWCSKMGFMKQHKRLPRSTEELSAAYWQGERLTAIEGRYYKQALEQGKHVKPDDFIQQAREELHKHQKAPDHIMAFAKASELTSHRQEQFEQHVLMHRDKTGKIPSTSDLKAICQAIMTHQQFNKQETVQMDAKAEVKGVAKYQSLIEQQVILGRMGNTNENVRYELLNLQVVKEECAEKSQRFAAELQTQNNPPQERNRSKQREMDFGP